MKLFLDSSAFASLVLSKDKSEGLMENVTTASKIAISILCLPEIFYSLSRLHKQKKLSKAQYQKAKKRVEDILVPFQICGLSEETTKNGIWVMEQTNLNWPASLQIVSAKEWGSDMFYSYDKNQIDAAQKLSVFTN